MKRTTKAIVTALLAAAAPVLTSCGVYDDIGDCKTAMRVAFRYDRNMAWADAFSNQVKSVHLRAFDENGKLVLDKTDSSPALSAGGYSMPVDELQTCTEYTFVAWAEGDDRGDSYTFGSGESETALTAKVNRTAAGDGTQTVKNDLTPLFHAREEGQAFQCNPGSTQTITLPLTKDTKNVTVVLQQQDADAEGLNPGDFTFSITADNGTLAHDNSPVSGDRLTYTPWKVSTSKVGVDEQDTKVNALVANFTLNRLMAEPSNLDSKQKVRLTVSDKDGKTVLSVPLVDYCMLVKDNYREMSDQEYLDRQDTYNMTFFISGGKWLAASILINGWRVVPPQNEGL